MGHTVARKKAKDLSREAWLIQKLRRISGMWPAKNEAINRAKEKVHIGFYKNGNAEYKTMIRCYLCTELHDRDNIQVDHVIPVVDLDGFKDWNTYIDQLFCDVSNLRPACKECHYLKTQEEKEERKRIKQEKANLAKKVKKDDNLY